MTQDAQDRQEHRPFIVTARDDHSATIQLSRGGGGGYASSTANQNSALAAQGSQGLKGALTSTQTLFAGGKPYPEMPKISPVRPLVRSLGATGTAILGGIITSEEYNEDFYWKDGVRIYEQMLRSEGQIGALRSSIELPIRRTTWSIEPGSQDERDVEIAAFVETCLFHELRYTTSEGRVLTQKWDDVLRHALMSLWYGFMPFEQVWRLDDGWVKWARFIPLLPRTIWRWWVGADNELVGVQQWTFKDYGYQFTDIPADKLLLFVHRQEGNNYEGVSLLRQAYQHWWYKQQLYKIEAIAVERNAMNIPVFQLPENFTQNDVTAAQSQLGNLRANESAGVILPPGWGFEYAKNFQKYAMEIQPTIQHHDVLIARSALAQFLNLGSTETGAFALADVQTKTFLESLQAVCEYIEDVFNNDAIRRLVDYNFVDVESYPKLKAGKVALTDVKDIAGALATLVNMQTPIIHPDPQLEDFMRDQLGLPKAPVGVVQGTDPSAPDSGTAPENENDGETSDEGAAGQNAQSQQTQQSQQQSQPPDTTEDPGEDDQGGGGSDGGDGGGGGAGMTEARLLREAFAAVAGFDAVARAERFRFGPGYNPYRDNHGKFAPGPHAARPGEGGGHGGGGGAQQSNHTGHGGHAGGGGSAHAQPLPKAVHVANPQATAASLAKAQAAKGAGAGLHQPEPLHWEGKSPFGNWSTQWKNASATVHGEGDGKVTLTVHHGGTGKSETHTIEADHTHGKYQITDHQTGKVKHELSLKAVNDQVKQLAGNPISAKGYTMKAGKIIEAKHLGAPGAKPSAAQKKINDAAEQKQKILDNYDAISKDGANPAAVWEAHAVQWHMANGSMLRISRNADDQSFTVEHFKAKANPTTTVAESWHAAHTKDPHGEHTYESKPSETKVYKTEKGVQNYLVKQGAPMGAQFKLHAIAKHNASVVSSLPAGVSPHSTTGWNHAQAAHIAAGKALVEATHGGGVGQYKLTFGDGVVRIHADTNGSGALSLHYEHKGGTKESFKGLSVADAKANLTSHGFNDPQAHLFADMAHEDATRYHGAATKEQQARIDAVNQRRAQLDAKFGATYSAKAAKQHVESIYQQYPALRTALETHLSGGAHFQDSSVAAKMHTTKLTPAEKLAQAKEGLSKLREVSEWSLLHSPNVTREGTIRLFHGTNGKSAPSVWQQRLADAGPRRGTPFTSHFSVSRSFADNGKYGRLVIAAHVPVEAVMTHQGIRTDHLYAHEHEYTVGTGGIHDYRVVNLNHP